jgi:hypothetical protein
MQDMPPDEAAELGRDLWNGGFRPLPEVDADGRLVGVRMWRLRNGLVEYIVLRHTGGALAVRAFAQFSYQQPFQHGDVIDARSGYAVHALRWLLDTGRNRIENQGES